MSKLGTARALLRGTIARLIYPGKIAGEALALEPGCKFILNKGSQIKIEGRLTYGANCIKRNGRSTILRMDSNSFFMAKNSSVFYGADIILFENARFEIGESFINSDARIRVHDSIRIGDGCAISHGFVCMDSNAHSLDGVRAANPVVIDDHVWIGTGVTVLPGVPIGRGSVIAAGSVVTKDVPAACLAAGVPARIIREDVSWEK